MQVSLDRESAGRAQLVKSALICCCTLPFGLEQRALSATTYASLSANSAYICVSTKGVPREQGSTYASVGAHGARVRRR